MTELENELLQNLKYVLLDLQGALEHLNLDLHTATGIASSASEALALVKRLDPEWADPAAFDATEEGAYIRSRFLSLQNMPRQ